MANCGATANNVDLHEYLMSGWEEHVFTFDVLLLEKSVRISQTSGSCSTKWAVSVRGIRMKQRHLKLLFLTELLTCHRKVVFFKVWFHLSGSGGEVILKHGQKHCTRIGKVMQHSSFPIKNFTDEMSLRIAIISETAMETNLIDLMSRIDREKNPSYVTFPDASSDSLHIQETSSGTYELNDMPSVDSTSTHATIQQVKDCHTIWEKNSFIFGVICIGNSVSIVPKHSTHEAKRCKWRVTCSAGSLPGTYFSLRVSTKLLISPRKVAFVKVLYLLSSREGQTIIYGEQKCCLRVGHAYPRQFKRIEHKGRDMTLKVIIISDTLKEQSSIDMLVPVIEEEPETCGDNSEPIDDDDIVIIDNESTKFVETINVEAGVSSSILCNMPIKQEKDEIMSRADSPKESSAGSQKESSINLKEMPVVDLEMEPNDIFIQEKKCLSLPDNKSLVALDHDNMTFWEKCICSFRIDSKEDNLLTAECLNFKYDSNEVSNEWDVAVDASMNNEDKIGNIFVMATLRSTRMKKVLTKFAFRLSSKDNALDFFRNKCCYQSGENRVHGLKDITLSSLPVVLEVVIHSEINMKRAMLASGSILSNSAKDTNRTDSEWNDLVFFESGGIKLGFDAVKLAHHSDVFRNMFENDKTEAKDRQIALNEFSPLSLCQMLTFINNKTDLILDQKSATELLQISDRYRMSKLKHECESFLITLLNESNVMRFLLLADTHSAIRLKEAAIEFICKNQENFCQDNKYDELNNRPDLLKKILVRLVVFSTSEIRKSDSNTDQSRNLKRRSLPMDVERGHAINKRYRDLDSSCMSQN